MKRLSVRVGVGVNPFGEALTPGELVEHALLLEELGYDSIWLSDGVHFATPAPLVALAAVAARTTALKLGTGLLILPPRNPVLVAKELATLDALSAGRLLPAVGIGSDAPNELEASGVRRGERGARFEEAIALLKRLWTEDRLTYRGRFYAVTDLRLEPRPKKRLELWLGGKADGALRRVGRYGDGWLAAACAPSEFSAGVQTILAAADEAGRTIELDHFGVVLFCATSAEAIPAELLRQASRFPAVALEDQLAVGVDASRALLERFLAEGASKFVVIPVAPPEQRAGWVAELKEGVVEPVERVG